MSRSFASCFLEAHSSSLLFPVDLDQANVSSLQRKRQLLTFRGPPMKSLLR